MLVGGVIDHQLRNHFQTTRMGRLHKQPKVGKSAVVRMYAAVVRNIIAIIAQGRRIERQQPQRRHAEILEVVEFLEESFKIANAVAIAIVKGPHMEFVNDRILIPQWLTRNGRPLAVCHSSPQLPLRRKSPSMPYIRSPWRESMWRLPQRIIA